VRQALPNLDARQVSHERHLFFHKLFGPSDRSWRSMNNIQWPGSSALPFIGYHPELAEPEVKPHLPLEPFNIGSHGVKRGPRPPGLAVATQQTVSAVSAHRVVSDGVVFAHEALIRGPEQTAFHTPDTLLLAAEREN